MGLENSLNQCLASQQIRNLIKEGRIVTSLFDESRIQPSSFDPVIEDELFILDPEAEGLFRPNRNKTIYEILLRLPNKRRQKASISDGFELKKGFSYLIKLEERVKLSEGEYIKSSQKSSCGRLFLDTRLLGDFNPCFDEVRYSQDKEVNLWLLVQPLAFNVIVHPGISLNQLRFYKGGGARLTPQELKDEIEKNPILYVKRENGLLPTNQIVADGLEIHLDLSGVHTEDIIGLRARRNPVPIDLSAKGRYEAEDFFEPIKVSERITIESGEYYLLASSEILKVPAHLNVEFKSHSHLGFHGPLHFAGFVDNGFEGDLVFEVRSDELSRIELEDGMPISTLDVFKTELPDKLYGIPIGSNYQGQVGVRPSKYFKVFDFTYAARNYKKLNRLVLCQDASILTSHRKTREGFEVFSGNVSKLYEDIKNGFFHSRYDCEDDELVLQPIPYVLLFGPEETIFSYIRAKDIKDFGDRRLFGKHSVGLGGHIITADGPDYIKKCLEREVLKEEVSITGMFSEPKLVGTLMSYEKPVDRVHFGLIFAIHVNGSVEPKESSIISGKMVPINELISDASYPEKYETWSKILIPHLLEIYRHSRH